LEKLNLAEISSDARPNFANIYFDVESILSRELLVQQRRNSNANSTALQSHFIGAGGLNLSGRSKLPHLDLPRFCENYADWPDFYSMFPTVVNNDQELSKIKKIQYLRASLEGVALENHTVARPIRCEL